MTAGEAARFMRDIAAWLQDRAERRVPRRSGPGGALPLLAVGAIVGGPAERA